MSQPHVVAVRMGRLGDLVMVEPALRLLRLHSELTLVTGDAYAPAFARLLPGIQVVAAGSGGRNEADAPRLPDVGPADLVLDLHRVAASRRAMRRIPRRRGATVIRVGKEDLARRALLAPARPLRALLPAARLTWPERHLRAARTALQRLGLDLAEAGPEAARVPSLWREPRALPDADTPSLRRPLLGLSPGAAHAGKRWPLEHHRDLCRLWVRRTQGSVLILSAADEAELARTCLDPGDGSGSDPAVSLWPDPSLDGLVDGLLRCDVVVAGDTGPLHLAAALGRPVVGLFGPTPAGAGFWLGGPRARLLGPPAGLACAPCSLHGPEACPKGHHRCLRDITPRLALAAAESLCALP
jgi:ADP-heptose:LPS heptosyltransferase